MAELFLNPDNEVSKYEMQLTLYFEYGENYYLREKSSLLNEFWLRHDANFL